MNYLENNQKGFITLMSVVIASAIGIAVTATFLLLGISSTKTNIAIEDSNQAKNLANACAEDALEHIRESLSFVGLVNLSLGQGACSYTVTNTGGQTRLINASGTVATVTRKIIVTVTRINPRISYTWQEVADF